MSFENMMIDGRVDWSSLEALLLMVNTIVPLIGFCIAAGYQKDGELVAVGILAMFVGVIVWICLVAFWPVVSWILVLAAIALLGVLIGRVARRIVGE